MTRCSRSTALLLLTATVCAVSVVGCSADRDSVQIGSSRSSKDPKRMKPDELQQYVSTKAAIAAADAAAAMTLLPTEPLTVVAQAPVAPTSPVPPTPPSPPMPAPPSSKSMTVVTQVVTPKPVVMMPVSTTTYPVRRGAIVLMQKEVKSEAPYESDTDARNDALRVAKRIIEEKLQALEHPVAVNLKPARIWNDFVVQSTARAIPLTENEREILKNSKAGANRMYYAFDVEVSEEQIMKLRGEERIRDLFPLVIGGVVVSGLLSGLLRILRVASK